MGHYYSEMRQDGLDEKLRDFLSEDNVGRDFTLVGPTGKKLYLTRDEIYQLVRERKSAMEELDEVRTMVRRLALP